MPNLNPEEIEILQELSQPEEAAAEDQFQEDDSIQRNIVGAMLSDRQFLVSAFGLVKPRYFRNEAHQVMCDAVFKYFEKYKKSPTKEFVYQEMKDRIAARKPEVQQYFEVEFETTYDYYIPGLDDMEYLLDRITTFAKTQALKVAFEKCTAELKKNKTSDTWLKIYDVLSKAMTVDRDFSAGLDYFATYEERYARMLDEQEHGELFTSGFEAIDNAIVGGGLSRGEVGSWMGLPGTGKSLALVAAALANIHHGKKVLYVSLEMDQDKVAQRFDAQIVNVSKQYDGKVTINNLLENKEIVFESLRDYIKDYEFPTLLVVKQFPAGDMDIATFRAYLTQMKLRDFTPDLIILDYVGEMKDYPDMPTWESRNKIVRDLRGIAVIEKVCILTAMQPGREARSQSNDKEHLGFIDDNNLADAYGQSRPIDAMWSINQFQDEKEAGLARIFVVKHRNGRSRFTFHVEFDYNTLRMSQISTNLYEKRLKEYQNSKVSVGAKNAEKDLKKRQMEDKIDNIGIRDADEQLRDLMKGESV